jgi:DNA-binding NarL/FixJ family response regulator
MPGARPAAPQVGNAAWAAGVTAGSARLHCRDHPVFRSGLAQSLRRAADVEIATVGGTADEAVRAANTASIDVLLLDLTIPGDGKEAARRILRENPAARILILTGSNKEVDVAATLAIGAMGYVQKVRAVGKSSMPSGRSTEASRSNPGTRRAHARAAKPSHAKADLGNRRAAVASCLGHLNSRSWTLPQKASTIAKLRPRSA